MKKLFKIRESIKDKDKDREKSSFDGGRRRNPSISSQLTGQKALRLSSVVEASPSPSTNTNDRQIKHFASLDDMKLPTRSSFSAGRQSSEIPRLESSSYTTHPSLSNTSINEFNSLQAPNFNHSNSNFETSSILSSDIANDVTMNAEDFDDENDTMNNSTVNTLNNKNEPDVDVNTNNLANVSLTSHTPQQQVRTRRGSQTSTVSAATNMSYTSNQSELKKAFPLKNRISTKNRSSFILRPSASNLNLASNSSQSPILSSTVSPSSPSTSSASIQSLVKPEWDTSILRNGWVNRIADSQEGKLFRIELKGSSLNVYKLPTELAHVKSLIVQSPDIQDNASTVQSLMQNDFIKSSSDLSTINNATAAVDQALEEQKIEQNDEPTPITNIMPHSDSVIFSDIIDDFLTSQSETQPKTLDPNAKSINKASNTAESTKTNKNITGNLSYQSPSCPHPELEIDLSSGLVLDGSFEAICHTIIFFPSESIAVKLISSLPMIGDLNIFYNYFTRYFDLFTNSKLLAEKSLKLTELETNLLFARIRLVIETSIANFKGALLSDTIFTTLSNLLKLMHERNVNSRVSDLTLKDILKSLKAARNSLIQLSSFQIQSIDPVQPISKSQSDLISADDFLKLDIDDFVHQIHALDAHFMQHWNPQTDKSTVFTFNEVISSSYNYWRYNPLHFFPQFHTHYLGRLLAFHLFEDNNHQLSSTHAALKRAQVLTKWIQVGEKLQHRGDSCAWLGIAIMVCSQPVLRLNETWSHIGSTEIKIITRSWAPCVFEIRKQEMFSSDFKTLTPESDTASRIIASNKIGESYAKEDAVPYFGEILTHEGLIKLTDNQEGIKKVKSISAYHDYINWNLKEWKNFYDETENAPGVTTKFNIDSTNPSYIMEGEDSETFNVIKNAICFNISNGPCNLEQIMNLSIMCEQPYVGKLAPFHKISRSPLFLGSYASILFPEVSSHYEIYNQSELIGAIGGGNVINLKELKHKNRNVFLKRVRDLFNEGNDEFRLVDGSITFKTIESITSTNNVKHDDGKKSRPSSILFENPDIMSKHISTLSTNSFNLDDYITSYQTYLKDAITAQNDSSVSSNTLNTDASESNNNKINIITTAATPDRLVDLLVLTASIFGTNIRPDDIKNYASKTSNEGPLLLRMDDSGFTSTFFATYRMFFTTKQLIDALQRRFEGSKSAALSIADFMKNNGKENGNNNQMHFPSWDSEIKNNDNTWSKINWKFVAQIQLGVIESTLTLVTDYFTHFMDDLTTKSTFDTFLEMIDICIISEWPEVIKWLEINTSDENAADILEVFVSLQSAYKQVRNICIRKSYTPQIEPVEIDFSNELTEIPEHMKLPSSTDIDQVVKFVNKLDITINSVVSKIRPNDWINTFEILQLLITDPLAMFNYKYQDANTHQGLIKISNIYEWIMTLNDSKTFGSSNEKIIDALPPTVRSALKLYSRVNKYILMQIVDSKYNIDERIDVMCTLLKIIRVCRLRMKNVKLFEDDDEEKSPFVPSFIESVVVNSILSPESRFFSYAWKQAASVWNPDQSMNINVDTLESILPIFNDYEVNAVKDNTLLSICPGWILSRLVEIVCFVPNMGVEDTTLINFDKNRFLHNCVLKVNKLQKKSNPEPLSPYLTEFSFLFEFSGSLPSLKYIYASSSTEVHAEKLTRCFVFNKHIQDQIQLLKLEEKKRTLLLRQTENQSKSHFRAKNNFDSISEEVASSNSSAVNIETPAASEKQDFHPSVLKHSLKRTTTGSSTISNASNSTSHSKFKFGFFKSRPFSININNFSQPAPERKNVTVDELPPVDSIGTNKSKPYLTIPLKEVSVFPTYRTPNSFTIDLNSNHTEYTFQTADEQEVGEWIYEITYSKKHWYYSKSLNKSNFNNNVQLTFGAPLNFVCERDNAPVPLIFEKILSEIELRGLEEIGIYRKSGSHSIVQQIKGVINKVGDFNMENALVFDVHNLTGLVKAFLRDLPESLIPDELVDDIVVVREIAKDNSRFGVYRGILEKLPMANYNLIERLTRHMKLIEEYQSQNKMTSYNLATIMGGSLVECGRPETLKKTFGLMNFVCEDWILNYDSIFL